MADSTSGFALAAMLGGAIFLYAGIKGVSVLKAIQAVIQGKSPATVAPTNQITGTTGPLATSTGTASQTGSGAASVALSYEGHCYRYGGAPGTGGLGCWDCSSFANWVFGAQLGLALPGIAAGGYDGSGHGPATGSWLTWGGAKTITAASAQPGDVVVWATHMGIYIGGGQMISALNPSLGTAVTTVASGAPGGEGSGTYRRINA